MSSAVNMVRRGIVNGSGAEKTVFVGFKPSLVQLENTDGLVSVTKTDLMDGDSAVKRDTNGVMTFPADLVTLEAGGFKLGTDADLNVDGEKIHWVAWQARND